MRGHGSQQKKMFKVRAWLTGWDIDKKFSKMMTEMQY